MIITSRHHKVLALAASNVGMSADLYLTQARELAKAGLVEFRTVYSKAGGNAKFRVFLVRAA